MIFVVLHSYQDCDGTVRQGHRESASVLSMHDPPIVSCHDGQEKNMISKGDGQLSMVDNRHSKSAHECRTQWVKSAAEDRYIPSQTKHDGSANADDGDSTIKGQICGA